MTARRQKNAAAPAAAKASYAHKLQPIRTTTSGCPAPCGHSGNGNGSGPQACRAAEISRHSGVRSSESTQKREPMPIWLAALCAARCHATDGGEGHVVPWNCKSGRAVYTNAGDNAQQIEPLGVNLQVGHTLEVYWRPGETAYTLEVYRHKEMCA
jgi:hypothetical protein